VSLATAAPRGQTPGSRDRFKILRQGKVGFIDRTGQVVIPAEFEGAEDFSDGRAAFSVKVSAYPFTKYGYIDESGKAVISRRSTWPTLSPRAWRRSGMAISRVMSIRQAAW
jgi:hypothetical protein